jgi:hypothetical protein
VFSSPAKSCPASRPTISSPFWPLPFSSASSTLVTSFQISGFWPAFFGAVVISIVSLIANALIGKPEKRPAASETPAPSRSDRRPPPPGKGPIIDV